MRKDGLYITLSPEGKIKRYLHADYTKIPLEDTTIAEELIGLTEQNHIHFYQAIKEIWALAGLVKRSPNDTLEFTVAMEAFLRQLRKENILRHTLLMTQMGDVPRENPFERWDEKKSAFFIADQFLCAMAADITVNRVLSALSDGRPIDMEEEHDMLRSSTAIVTFTFDGSLSEEYQFRSEEQYFIFLLQRFLLSKPNVAVCQYCGRYFMPKTSKNTKYCDRIVRDGKSCKQIAPYIKHREKAAANRVIAKYDQVKNMLQHRLERAEYDKMASPIDLTFEEYVLWEEKARQAKADYLAGNISEEEAIRIIHVPTIQELRASDKSDCTPAGSGV